MSARVRKSLNLGVNVRAKALTTVSDATSQKFILLGQLSRNDQREGDGRYTVIYLDFAGTQPHKCEEKDFERWYARAKPETECLMGIKVSPASTFSGKCLRTKLQQWYNRRKADADCYVGNKFVDPVVHEDRCPCQDHDYEW